MTAQEVYALISGRDVMNIVVGDYYNCNEAAKRDYGASAFAIEVSQYPVQPGDHYLNGVFYRGDEGEEETIDPIPTEAEQIAKLSDAVSNIELALIELYEMGDET